MESPTNKLLPHLIQDGKVAFLLCDMQEKFRPVIAFFPEILAVCSRMIKASNILGIPLLVTEQYPKGLGETVPELDISHAVANVPKTQFSMLVPEISSKLAELRPNVLVVFGGETHVCIRQTVFDALKEGYFVHVLADGCSSRFQSDRLLAFQELRQAGAVVTTSEAVLFQLLRDKNHPKFKEIQALVKGIPPDSGLAHHL